MTPEFIQQAVMLLISAGAVYGGIRADIKAIHERIATAEKAIDKAHDRIDNLK